MHRIALALFCVACSSEFADDRVYGQAQTAAIAVSFTADEGVLLVTMTFTNGSLAQIVQPKIAIAWTPDSSQDVQLVGLDGTSSFELGEHEERTMSLVGAFSASTFDWRLCDRTVLVADLPTNVDCRK